MVCYGPFGESKNPPPPADLHFTVAGSVSVKEISDEAIALLADRGVDLSGLEATIPADLEFPLYKNAFRMLFVYAYLFAAGAKRCGVAATAADGRLTLVFRSSKGSVVRHLRDSLTDDKAPLPFATGRGDDTAFEVGALRGFVAQALEQLAPEMSYAEDRSEFSLTFAAARARRRAMSARSF